MRNIVFILIVIVLWHLSCKKNNTPDTSGSVTINNDLIFDQQLQTYINYGFLFSQAKLVPNAGASTKPDITVDNDGTLDNLILQGKVNSRFYKAGEFADANLARQSFENLTTITVKQWEDWAFSIKPNQIWIFATVDEHYAKIRIISTISEVRGTRNYAECTFEWVYQPDGSLTFPGK